MADAVKPVTSPGLPLAAEVYLNVIKPLLKVLGLPNVTLVVPLLHKVCRRGSGTTCGVGLIVIITVLMGFSVLQIGLIGTMVYVTV